MNHLDSLQKYRLVVEQAVSGTEPLPSGRYSHFIHRCPDCRLVVEGNACPFCTLVAVLQTQEKPVENDADPKNFNVGLRGFVPLP